MDYDLDLSLSLSCMEALQAMAARYPEHNTGVFRSENKRRDVVIRMKLIQAGIGNRQQLIQEAHQMLTQAFADTHDSIVLKLKCVITWCELRIVEGEIEAARIQLQAALDPFCERDAAVITHALNVMRRLEALSPPSNSIMCRVSLHRLVDGSTGEQDETNNEQ
jgi:hypothetical protein